MEVRVDIISYLSHELFDFCAHLLSRKCTLGFNPLDLRRACIFWYAALSSPPFLNFIASVCIVFEL